MADSGRRGVQRATGTIGADPAVGALLATSTVRAGYPCANGRVAKLVDGGMATRGVGEAATVAALRATRCLNPHPVRVPDEAFVAEELFDARDVVQVKYEMVRRVTVDGLPVTAAAAAFGYSRPSYYQAAAALETSGLAGLVPAKPGPRRGHKLTPEIVAWAADRLTADPSLRPAGLVDPIEATFDVRVHPRTPLHVRDGVIEVALCTS